ncbi:MAG: hypothetical protein KatS3mg009_2199 [Acidimicrobiia bacterium]|nr:MAG: hypothetical protein KatS3mg009_2199 [Acidimicrobiia bacterium]
MVRRSGRTLPGAISMPEIATEFVGRMSTMPTSSPVFASS